MRTLQEWLGHRDFKTTLRYADYAPGADEAELIAAATSTTNSRAEQSSAKSARALSALANERR
jgi:hypothetical protein